MVMMSGIPCVARASSNTGLRVSHPVDFTILTTGNLVYWSINTWKYQLPPIGPLKSACSSIQGPAGSSVGFSGSVPLLVVAAMHGLHVSTNSFTIGPIPGNHAVCLSRASVLSWPMCPSCATWITCVHNSFGITSCSPLTTIPSTSANSPNTCEYLCKEFLHCPSLISSLSIWSCGSASVAFFIIFLVTAAGSNSSTTLLT